MGLGLICGVNDSISRDMRVVWGIPAAAGYLPMDAISRGIGPRGAIFVSKRTFGGTRPPY